MSVTAVEADTHTPSLVIFQSYALNTYQLYMVQNLKKYTNKILIFPLLLHF